MYSSNTASSDTETEATNENNSESIIESSELEQQLKIIRSARLPATLWHTQQTLTQNLLIAYGYA